MRFTTTSAVEVAELLGSSAKVELSKNIWLKTKNVNTELNINMALRQMLDLLIVLALLFSNINLLYQIEALVKNGATSWITVQLFIIGERANDAVKNAYDKIKL